MTLSLRVVLTNLALTSALSLVPLTAYGAQTNAPEAPETALKVETIATGLVNPWSVRVLPDGRFLVAERFGALKLISPDGKQTAVLKGVPTVDTRGQGGLLDVALAPDFATSGVIFFSFSQPRLEGGSGTSVARARLPSGEEGDTLKDVTVIFQQQPAAESAQHFGSRLVFARDGSLFVTLGDRAIWRNEAQNPANHIGKLVHITASGEAMSQNPARAGWDAKVWSIGHRNVQGAALNPETGELWSVEHGAQGGDELNRPEAGKNYGWPVITYGRDYSGAKIGEGTAKQGLEQPVYYWDPSIAVSSMTFYSGSLFANWKGNILVSALKGAQLQRLVLENGTVIAKETLLGDLGERLRDVREAPDGSILVLAGVQNAKLLRLTPAK